MSKKNKKLLNKIVYISFLVFITSIFLNKILEFDFTQIIKSVATGTNEDENKDVKLIDGKLTYTGPDIRILEIEPADSFKLTYTINKRVTTGTETITKNKNNKEYKIEITHMTMAEFIGKTEQLNGKYDVIVIGRYIDDSLNGPNGAINYNIDNKNLTWFVDYCYLENDITNKKSKEIREFIQSGQLVYIDKTINQQYCSENANNNNYYSNNVSWTKLHYHLTDNNGDFVRDNLVNLNNFIRDKKVSDISIDDILNKYIEQSNKSLSKQIIYSNSPEGDTFGELGDINKRNMTFYINSKEPKDEELTINLYLDINGDGLYKEDEIVKTVSGVNFSKGYYELEYNIYEDYPQFIGYLDWRIEVVKDSTSYSQPIKSHYDGDILFRRLKGEEKRVINVLQISPYSVSEGLGGESSEEKGGKLNLKENKKFQSFLNEKELDDYEINIEVISYKDFYDGNYCGPGREDLNKSKYDMIIIGFCDSYPENGITLEAVKQLKEFVTAGKSLMLTHDTTSYWNGRNGLNIQNSSYFMKTFRDVIGQARYKDPNNISGLDFNGKIITHDPNGIENPNNDNEYMNQAGASFLNRGVAASTSQSIQVYKTNKSLLTSYPFELGDTIRVRRTHAQYLQLNLEDEDVVPIFNLTENNGGYTKNNRYDSRNFYYTYSRGNITFSGTGENKREAAEYPDDEMKLFINTIVKAERSANHKPIISGLSEEEATEVAATKDFNFNIVVKDPDKDKVKINSIAVQGEDISSINDLSTQYKESGTSYALKITSDILSKYIDKEITIKIEAEDEKKAISIKEYKIKVVSDAIITPKTVERKLVINQAETFVIELEIENDSNPTSISINNIENPQIEGIFGIENIKPINDNGKLKLEIKNLISYQKEKGREVNIPLKYTTGNKEKNVIIKIIYDSDYIRTESPDINVELISEKDIEIEDSKEITLEYTIKPQEFATSNMIASNKEIGEVIFILDINPNITGGQKTNIQNGMNNILINKNEYSNLKVGVLGFCDNPLFGVIEHNNNQYYGKALNKLEDINRENPFFTNNVSQEMDRYREVVSNIWNRQDNNNRDITNSLIIAKNIFDRFGNNDVGKAIVLILGDNIKDSQNLSKVANEIKASGYKIITLDISTGRGKSLENFHQSLGGVTTSNDYEGDYLVPTSIDQNYNNAKDDVQKIADRLKGSTSSANNYSVTPTFTFDLNDNFEYIQDSSTNINFNNLSGNELKFTLETPIDYTYSNKQNEKGEYIFTAQEQTISFKVKVKDEKIGVLNFGENTNILDISTYKNYFEYTNFKGTMNKKSLETPTVLVDDKMVVTNLKHGIYENIDSILENTDDELRENGNTRFEFYSPSKIKFAVSFETTSKSIKGTLNIDNKFDEVKSNDINIYRVKDNKLEKINLSSENIKELGDNDFEINIKNINENKENIKILMVYDTNIETANNIFINDFLGKKIKIKSIDNELNILPDLF